MTGPGPGDGDVDWGFNSPPDANLSRKLDISTWNKKHQQRAGERRAMYQECPLQVSLGSTRTEEGSTGWVGLSGDAWDGEDHDQEEEEEVARIY